MNELHTLNDNFLFGFPLCSRRRPRDGDTIKQPVCRTGPFLFPTEVKHSLIRLGSVLRVAHFLLLRLRPVPIKWRPRWPPRIHDTRSVSPDRLIPHVCLKEEGVPEAG